MSVSGNIDGDRQADLKLHGGPLKAVYAFPFEHYAFYQRELQQDNYPYGHFGENLTTKGMLETDVRIGDRYQIGGAVLEVSQPRSPCFKFGIKMGARDAIKICLKSGRTGFYLRVLTEGHIQATDAIHLLHRDVAAPSVRSVHDVYFFDKANLDALTQATGCAALGPAFKDELRARIKALNAWSN